MIEHVFPIPVGFYDYTKRITQTELDFFDNLKFVANRNNSISECRTLLDYKEMKRLRVFFNKCLSDYLVKTIAPPDSVRHYITHCWMNRTNIGESHHLHSHQNSIVSGVFYLKTVKDRDTITFHKLNQNIIEPYAQVYNEYNCHDFSYEAKEMQLILFPSTLPHSVRPISGDTDTRISISFNTFVTGSIDSGVGRHPDGSDAGYINIPIIDYG